MDSGFWFFKWKFVLIVHIISKMFSVCIFVLIQNFPQGFDSNFVIVSELDQFK